MTGREGLSYRLLLEVTNALNSQRDTDSLWRTISRRLTCAGFAVFL